MSVQETARIVPLMTLGVSSKMYMRIKKLFIKMKAAALSGKAFGRMQKGDYRNAAIMLRKICRDIPDFENIEYFYYCLGKCHHHLGQVKTALKWLSKSHDIYQKGVKTNSCQRYLSSYRDTAELYCKVLRIEGNSALADSIITKIDWS